MATTVETTSAPRSNLPNVYTDVVAREVDFVSRFTQNWEALRNILGIMRPIRKAPGTRLASYTASVTLSTDAVPAGAVIPYSKHTITEAFKADIDIKKYAHAVTLEEVAKYGAAVAVEKSDAAFMNELQSNVLTDFFTFLNTGTLTATESKSWQMALARAKGMVLDKFNTMRKTVTDVVAFVNVLDFYSISARRKSPCRQSSV